MRETICLVFGAGKPIAYFDDDREAKRLAKALGGISWVEVPKYDYAEELVNEYKQRDLRRQALAKLTLEEAEALGLGSSKREHEKELGGA